MKEVIYFEKIQKQNEDLNNLGEIKKRNDLEIFELN